MPSLPTSEGADGPGTQVPLAGSIVQASNGFWGSEIRGQILCIDPCIPRSWPGYSINFRYHSASYQISVRNPSGVCRGIAAVSLDGRFLADRSNIPLADDGASHQVLIVLG